MQKSAVETVYPLNLPIKERRTGDKPVPRRLSSPTDDELPAMVELVKRQHDSAMRRTVRLPQKRPGLLIQPINKVCNGLARPCEEADPGRSTGENFSSLSARLTSRHVVLPSIRISTGRPKPPLVGHVCSMKVQPDCLEPPAERKEFFKSRSKESVGLVQTGKPMLKVGRIFVKP